jgi:hypothetical protein
MTIINIILLISEPASSYVFISNLGFIYACILLIYTNKIQAYMHLPQNSYVVHILYLNVCVYMCMYCLYVYVCAKCIYLLNLFVCAYIACICMYLCWHPQAAVCVCICMYMYVSTCICL